MTNHAIHYRDDIVEAIWDYEKKTYGKKIDKPRAIYVEIDGELYSRDVGDSLYVGCAADDYNLSRIKDVKYKLPKKPYAVCICGCSEFKLFYGSYEISGICVNCGREDILYDG